MDLKALGGKIREMRKGLGMTQEDLAAAASVSHRVLQRLEGGSGNPTIETLSALAYHLGIPIEGLLGSANPTSPKLSDLSAGEARILEILERQASAGQSGIHGIDSADLIKQLQAAPDRIQRLILAVLYNDVSFLVPTPKDFQARTKAFLKAVANR